MFLALFMFSCSSSDDNTPDEQEQTPEKETVVVFFPYTVNLYKYLSKNISDIETAMLNRKDNPKVLVYINESKKKSCIYSIERRGNECVHDTLRVYDGLDYTTSEGLGSLFSEIKSFSPGTTKYSMIVGCHGMGWIYADDYDNAARMSPKLFTENYEENPLTRWIGVKGAFIDMDTFASAMEKASLHTHLIYFDVCYMGNIESLYELRNVSDYIVGSSVEIMGRGTPYDLVWNDLVDASPESLNNICRGFYEFYNNSDQPYATMAAVDCSRLDALAAVVKEINASYSFPKELTDSLQVLDGYRPSVFYDMGRYVELQCKDDVLRARYDKAFSDAVIYSYNTSSYYTSISQGALGTHDIKYCSGITTSAPSVNILSTNGWHKTAWYKATH